MLFVDFGLSFKEDSDPQIQVALHNIAVTLVVLAAGLVPAGSSVATNDITYVYSPLIVFVFIGNTGLVPIAALVLFNMNVFVPVMTAMIWRTVLISANITLLYSGSLSIMVWMVIDEKLYRRQFLEHQVAQHFNRKHAQRHEQLASLLKTIVPAHVIDPLMLWMGEGMDTKKSMVQSYDMICVGFIELSAPTSAEHSQEDGPITGETAGDSHDEHHVWLIAAIQAVDKILQKYPAVVKIKTIGEKVMLAGPFDPQYTVAQAADQAIAIVSELRFLTSISVGLHCGPIVGAILGTNRLCFDIFGDSVNTASRAMSTGGDGDATVTAEFFEVFTEARQVENCHAPTPTGSPNVKINQAAYDENSLHKRPFFCRDVQFSEPIERVAKGKGVIYMRTVTQFASNMLTHVGNSRVEAGSNEIESSCPLPPQQFVDDGPFPTMHQPQNGEQDDFVHSVDD